MKKSITKESKTLVALAIFGIAMGLLEAAVVVYLRQLYYPRDLRFLWNQHRQRYYSLSHRES